MANKIQFTKEGYLKLELEHKDLVESKRGKAVTRLAKARSMGDLSENSEYSAAKEELAFVEGRIKEVEELMRKSEIVSSSESAGVTVGTDVLLEKDGKEETYSIVGEFEANPMNKKLSATSPIGRALLGKHEGDIVKVDVPAGTLRFKILKLIK